MSSFTTNLTVSPLPDGKNWVLKKPFEFYRESDKREVIRVQGGFSTDFASIPRGLWIVLPKWGRYGNAAVVHDYMYWRQETSRAVADEVMREAMVVHDVPRWQRAVKTSRRRTFP